MKKVETLPLRGIHSHFPMPRHKTYRLLMSKVLLLHWKLLPVGRRWSSPALPRPCSSSFRQWAIHTVPRPFHTASITLSPTHSRHGYDKGHSGYPLLPERLGVRPGEKPLGVRHTLRKPREVRHFSSRSGSVSRSLQLLGVCKFVEAAGAARPALHGSRPQTGAVSMSTPGPPAPTLSAGRRRRRALSSAPLRAPGVIGRPLCSVVTADGSAPGGGRLPAHALIRQTSSPRNCARVITDDYWIDFSSRDSITNIMTE